MKITNLISSLVLLVVSAGCLFGAPTTMSPFVLAYQARNVLYVTTNGNDSTALRGHSELPFATLTGAIAQARSGDKIAMGVGNFTNSPSYIALPSDCVLGGLGTNNTFIYSFGINCNSNNELSGFQLIASNDGSGTTTTSVGALQILTNNYVHDVIVVSANKCLGGAPGQGYNVYSNCLFITSSHGIIVQGTDYFFNCRVSKTNNTSSTSSYLLAAQFNSFIYWSGGSLISITNATGQATNNCGLFHGSTSSGTQNFFIQNSTISVPTGGYDVFGKSGVTNFVLNATYTQTNTAAINIAFAGFSNTNSAKTPWRPSWSGNNTNKPPVLLVPPH